MSSQSTSKLPVYVSLTTIREILLRKQQLTYKSKFSPKLYPAPKVLPVFLKTLRSYTPGAALERRWEPRHCQGGLFAPYGKSQFMHLLRNPDHAEGSCYLDTIPRQLGGAPPKQHIVIRIRLRSLQLPVTAYDLLQLSFLCLASAMRWSKYEVSHFPSYLAAFVFPYIGFFAWVFGIKLVFSTSEEQVSATPWNHVLTSAELILSYTLLMDTILVFPWTLAACTLGLTVLVISKPFLVTETAPDIRSTGVLKTTAGFLLTATYLIAYVIASRVNVVIDLCLGKYPSDISQSLAQCLSLIQGKESMLITSMKLGVEASTQVRWKWWPLSPTFKRQAAGQSKVQWHCVSQRSFPPVRFSILTLQRRRTATDIGHCYRHPWQLGLRPLQWKL